MEERDRGADDGGGLFTQITLFLTEVLRRDGLQMNEELQVFLSPGEDTKSGVLFSPEAIIFRKSRAEMESLRNFSND